MKFNLKLTQQLFFCLTPLVTGSVFMALPSYAATLATSETRAHFSNFSHNPLLVETTTNPTQLETTNNNQVTTQAQARAAFDRNLSNPSQTTAFTTSSSTVQGNGIGYAENIDSSAVALGYYFQVAAGQTFSFDFNGLLDLATSTDVATETANSYGTVVFQVYDYTDSTQSPVLLDFFTAEGSLNSLDNSDFLTLTNSNYINLGPTSSTSRSFGGNQETARTSFQGRFSRFFDQTRTLILRAFNSNSTGASCPSR
jgi:hypothetical protein